MHAGDGTAVEVVREAPAPTDHSGEHSAACVKTLDKSSEAPRRRATGELVVEHTDFRKAKNIWQEKLDVAMAKKEQEQIIAELNQMRTSDKASERATYQLLREEGYTVEANAIKERQEKKDEILAQRFAEEQEQHLKRDATASGSVPGGVRRRASYIQPSHHNPVDRHIQCRGEDYRGATAAEGIMHHPTHEREMGEPAHHGAHLSGPHFLPVGVFHTDSNKNCDNHHRHSHMGTSTNEGNGSGDDAKPGRKTIVQRLFSAKYTGR